MKVEGSRCWCWWTRRLKSSGDSIEDMFVDLNLLGLFSCIIDLLAVDAASSREEGCIRVWKLAGVIEKAEQLHGWCTSNRKTETQAVTVCFFFIVWRLDLKELSSVGSAIHWLFASAFRCMGCVSAACSLWLGCSITVFIREFVRSLWYFNEWWHDSLDARPTQNHRKRKGLIPIVSRKIRSIYEIWCQADLVFLWQLATDSNTPSLSDWERHEEGARLLLASIVVCAIACSTFLPLLPPHRTLFQIWTISFFEI